MKHVSRRRFRQRAGWAAACLLLAATVVNAAPTTIPSVQDKSPVEFSLSDLNGGTVRAADVQGKVTVMLFGAKGLPMMRESIAQIQRVADKHPNINVYLVVTNSSNPKDSNYVSDDDLRTMVSMNKLRVPVLRDPGGEQLFKPVGLRILPSLIILNRKGELAAAAREGLDPRGDLASQLTFEIDNTP